MKFCFLSRALIQLQRHILRRAKLLQENPTFFICFYFPAPGDMLEYSLHFRLKQQVNVNNSAESFNMF